MIWIIALAWVLIGLGTWGYSWKDLDAACHPFERRATLFLFLGVCVGLGPLMTAVVIGDWLYRKIRRK